VEKPKVPLTITSKHEKILDGIRDAVERLKMKEQSAIVGGFARHLNGDPKMPGDIDVLIERPLCERYWDFLEVLVRHGLFSLRDVIDRPAFEWNPLLQRKAHARALAVSAPSNPNDKSGALDVCFSPENLDFIPHSDKWVLSILESDLCGPNREQAIKIGREKLKDELSSRMCELQPAGL
jgi:hypothetical protein